MGNFNWNNNPYSNTYNPGGKQHPNFGWNSHGTRNFNNTARQNAISAPTDYNQPMQGKNIQQGQASSYIEDLLKEYMANNDYVIQSQAASVQALKNQLGQIANALSSRPQRVLQSDTENLRSQRKEQCKAITLRSGTQLNEIVQDATDFQLKRFLKVLKQLHIHISVVEALEQIPNYMKFMKDILSKKHRLGEFKTVALTEGYTAILMNKLPPKLKNPESFTILCLIGNHYVGKALCDLGASINLMSLSVFKKLGIVKARPTIVTLQLADQSYVHVEGKIENMLVTFNVFNTLKCADENEECRNIDLIEIVVEEEFIRFYHSNSDSDKNSFEWRPLCILLEQNRPFNFDEQCLVAHVYPHGAVDVMDMFKVNGQRLKHY
ncbi:uncharacterized protein LOC108466240 [Gossypium arboreum]|uniref:uncharacterized protein LOC108466240 n=1 Tax=Gossypium arboreum TaxID=29729 RepID=UPI0008191BD0|nr:uncharacterized protein LOC108466240 [Gossypium arboreum]